MNSTLSSAARERVLKKINQALGSDIENLKKCPELLEEELNKEKNIKNNASTLVEKSMQTIKETMHEIHESHHTLETLNSDYKEYMDGTEELRVNLHKTLQDIDVINYAIDYLKAVDTIMDYNSMLQDSVSAQDDEESCTLFANLCELSNTYGGMPVKNLNTYLNKIILHWHGLLATKFLTDFEALLKQLKWPFTTTTSAITTSPAAAPLASSPPLQQTQRLQMLCEYLFQMDLPPALSRDTGDSGAPAAISALVKPLRKRFVYHFCGARQTNRPDKPEWYFTQILAWLRDHEAFVERWFQPVVDRLGLHHIVARTEFAKCLVNLAVEKLRAELPALQYDDFSFSHCIDEALGFHKELKQLHNFPDWEAGVLAVLTEPHVFLTWLAMEKKYATEKLDRILSSDDAFYPYAEEEDEMRVPNCADAFVTLLQTVQERYEILSQPGHQLQFLDLQLELLDDFRVRLLQLVHETPDERKAMAESRLPAIANAVHYVHTVVEDWGDTLLYLKLSHFRSQLRKAAGSHDGEFSVFDETMSLYKRMSSQLVRTLVDAMTYDLDSLCLPYINESWPRMVTLKDARGISLTPTAGAIMDALANRLHQLQKYLAAPLFTTAWQAIADSVDQHLYKELVLDNNFNEGGAAQLRYDVFRNLYPLFAQFTAKPEAYFPRLNDSCTLLNLATGSAILLRENLVQLKNANGVEDTRPELLADIGVRYFKPERVLKIISLKVGIGDVFTKNAFM